MTSKEFFSLGLIPGDRVTVTLQGESPVEAFFDGLRTYGSAILRNLDWDLYPVFRAVSKSGKMLTRTPFDRNRHNCSVALSIIQSIERPGIYFDVHPAASEETVEVLLSDASFPKAFQAKLDELMEQQAFPSREEAVRYLRTTPVVLELYYEKDHGLFAVESEALDTTFPDVHSPYSGKPLRNRD